MKKIIFLILILIIIVARPSAAQNAALGEDNIKFHSSEAINEGKTLNMSNDFIIRGSSEIEWTQPAADKTIYTITNTNGTWGYLNEQGEIEFSVLLGSRTGKIRLYKTQSGTMKLRIEMYRNNVDLVPFEFIISSFEKLN